MTGRRAESRRRNREALIAAAEQLFMSKGYKDVSVQAIAQAADLTSGAIYSIFGSKLDLLFAVLDHTLDGPDAALATLDDDQTMTAVDILKMYAKEHHRIVASLDGLRALRLEVDVMSVLLRSEEPLERLRWGIRRNELLGSVLTSRAVAADDEHRLTGEEAERLACAASAMLRGLALQQVLTGSGFTAGQWGELASALTAAVGRL
ncbi:TetR/AcrR family transcriptional regulator [Streptomyces sp. NPDC002870]|uniref:TetR/AcrR family transcriptional regulator n=1 Tax=Streptomyces sp. NPDC002870 TaxID=3364666 RepID=UPI00367B5335